MYAFATLAIPLGFILTVIVLYPAEDRTEARRAFAKGLVAYVPLLIIQSILETLTPAVYGTPFIALRDWTGTILPCAAFPAIAYLAFYRYGDKLPSGCAERRLTAFYAGALSPVGLAAAIRVWERPDPYTVLVQPFFLAAICLAAPTIAMAMHRNYGFRLVLTVMGALVASVGVSFGRWLFLVRFWPLGWLLAAAAIGSAWLTAVPTLSHRVAKIAEHPN